MSDLVTLVCPCGREFQATAAGVRAGRKWCVGSCADRHHMPPEKRAAYWRKYQRKNRRAA